MERVISKVEFNTTPIKTTKVAAYTRVSSGKDSMLHSLAQQVSHFKTLIKSHTDWEFIEVYSDEALTGTKDTRENFCRMVDDAKSGKIDLILAKSISRFARNTVTLLTTIRELKTKNIGIYFEEENINTLSSEGELLITILASYAQEESRSNSENQKWRIRKNFEEGIPWITRLYGYNVKNHTFTVNPQEAEVVKEIYNLYLNGNRLNKICRILNDKGIRTKNNNLWSTSTIYNILTNIYYTGNMVLQRTFSLDHITKRKTINKGEKPKYFVEENHEAIIDMTTFNKVQQLIAVKTPSTTSNNAVTPFAGKIYCASCGKRFKRKRRKSSLPIWLCRTYLGQGKAYCNNHQIREDILIEKTNQILGLQEFDESVFNSKIQKIVAGDDNTLTYYFKDNTVKSCPWENKSRSLSWTREKKEKARKKALNYLQGENNAKGN